MHGQEESLRGAQIRVALHSLGYWQHLIRTLCTPLYLPSNNVYNPWGKFLSSAAAVSVPFFHLVFLYLLILQAGHTNVSRPWFSPTKPSVCFGPSPLHGPRVRFYHSASAHVPSRSRSSGPPTPVLLGRCLVYAVRAYTRALREVGYPPWLRSV